MCLPHVTEHIVEGLQRRTFLGFVGGAAMASLVQAGEAVAAPRAPELDLHLEFAAQMAGSAIAYTLTLHNPYAQEIGRIHLIGPIPQGTIFRRILETPGTARHASPAGKCAGSCHPSPPPRAWGRSATKCRPRARRP
jgi:hypothetical protein